ncbi:MAG: hypothetical protein IKZ52_09540 [Bacteroidales bacterium]|nr:hypothetical protein [Bacteroidales bacterium]
MGTLFPAITLPLRNTAPIFPPDGGKIFFEKMAQKKAQTSDFSVACALLVLCPLIGRAVL